MRLIDADAYKDVLYGKRNNPSIRNGIQSATAMLNKEPTIDAIPVVRCKDCKWYRNGKTIKVMKFCYRMLNMDGEEVGYLWPEDGFCSYGERKADE